MAYGALLTGNRYGPMTKWKVKAFRPRERAIQVGWDKKHQRERLAPLGAKAPQGLRVSGFLEEDADLGQQVKVRTIMGSIHTGRLRIQNPGYGHRFCHTMPELNR